MKKLSALLVGILLLSGCGGGGDSEEGKRVCDISEDKKKLTIRRGKSTTIAYVVKGEIKILNK